MKNILESLRDKVSNGSITIKEAATALHEAGWTNFIDVDTTQTLLFKKNDRKKLP